MRLGQLLARRGRPRERARLEAHRLARDAAVARAHVRRAREYFAATDALEVETPILVRAAVTDVHLESLEVRRAGGERAGFLHTSPEYAMKRLLCAGAPDIYQVSKVFRDGERGRLHNPEFTMIEWYRLGIDHHALMDDVERLLSHMFAGRVSLAASRHLTYQGRVRSQPGRRPDRRPGRRAGLGTGGARRGRARRARG